MIFIVMVPCVVLAVSRALSEGRLAPLLPALLMETLVALVLGTTLRGKFLVWSELLDGLGLRGTRQHRQQLAKLASVTDVGVRRLDWRFWWGGPWAPTRLVTARKRARDS